MALEQLAFVEQEVDRTYRQLQDEKAKVLAFQTATNHQPGIPPAARVSG